MTVYCTPGENLIQSNVVKDIDEVKKVCLNVMDSVNAYNFYNTAYSTILAKNLMEEVHCIMVGGKYLHILMIDNPELTS